MLEQMAYLGWRPSADEGAFSPIPESIFPAPLEAKVTRYESPDGPLPVFEPTVVDSVWPAERHAGQYTRWRFEAGPGPDGTTYHWEFGDGQSSDGPKVEHVYLALGKYEVTLSAKGGKETKTVRWPLEVFEIENVNDQSKEGRPEDYAKIARGYDRSKLDAVGLRELTHLLAESEDPKGAITTGREFLDRFGAVPANGGPTDATAPGRLCLAAGEGAGGVDEAIAHFEASLTKETPRAEKLDVLARLIRLLGIDRALPEKAGSLLPKVEETVKGGKLDDETLAAYRRAVIAAGDVLLWNGKLEGARDLYKRAETLGGTFIPSQVRSARIGTSPTRSENSSTPAAWVPHSTSSIAGTRPSRPTSQTARPSSGAASCWR